MICIMKKKINLLGGFVGEENDYFGDSEEDFLKDMLGCDDEYTLDDFFDSFDPD